jgi:hypothetical protein
MGKKLRKKKMSERTANVLSAVSTALLMIAIYGAVIFAAMTYEACGPYTTTPECSR